MKLQIEFFYDQDYLPTSRHKIARKRSVEGSVTVNIKEPLISQFPVAFIIHDYQSVQPDMHSYLDYDSNKCEYRMFSEEIRAYNGKLYKPVRVTHGAAISTVFEMPSFLQRQLENVAPEKYYATNEFSEHSVVLCSNIEQKKKAIRSKAKEFLSFYGIIWELCSEPRYLVCTFGLGHNHGGTGFFIEYHYNPNIPARNYFTALQREKAIEYGKKVAWNRGDTKSVDGFGENDYIEVLMPEMVKLNPLKEHGEGDAFLNQLETITDHSESALEAGLLVMLAATNVTKEGKK